MLQKHQGPQRVAFLPTRRCAGCGRTAPKSELLRIAAVDGIARLDPDAQLPGRGTYACSPTCLERVANRRALSRALRGPVAPPADPPLTWPQGPAPLPERNTF